MARFIVLSGLPASGKSTVGAALAAELRLPLIDKDTILEAMFDTIGVGDAAWRAKLSRSADCILERMARASAGAVLVSWWRHPNSSLASGTPTQWLRSLDGEVIEIHCDCEPSTAAARFFARQRHAGHLDHARSLRDELEKFRSLATLGSIGAGRVIEIRTDGPLDIRRLAAEISMPP